MIPRTFLSVILLLGSGVSLCAAEPPKLDPEPALPYQWTILLHTRPHPLLSPAFRTDVRRQLLAALQPAIGSLGTVEVIDLASLPQGQWPTLAKDYESRGWTALDASHLRELTGVKTQILHLELRGNEYLIETRQLDGFTGLPLPVSRRRTNEAGLVGRIAGLMLDREFGLDGTLDVIAKTGDEATVHIRGSGLGSLDRFLKKDDIFAVSAIRKSTRPPGPPPKRTATGKLLEAPKDPPPSFTAITREFTLLKALEAPKDGAVRCKIYTGYPSAFPVGGGIIGYRCMKLPTVSAPLALRLVGSGGKSQRATSASVRANDIGWAAPSADLELRDGVFRSTRSLDHIALVTLSSGQSRNARVPIPVFGGEPVAIPFSLDAGDDRRVAFERDCIDLARRVAEARITQAGSFDAIGKLITASRNREALARASAGLALSEADDKELTAALNRLREQVSISPGNALLLDTCERQLADIRATHSQLLARAGELEKVVANENVTGRAAQETQAEAINTRIKILLERGEVDEALTVYDQLITLLPDNPDLVARRDKLREETKPKSDEHEAARAYLERTWPALATIRDLKESLEILEAAVDECILQKDRYACRKLLISFGVLPVKVSDLTQPLDGAIDADRMLLQDANAVLEAVTKTEIKVRAFLKSSP